MQVSATLIAAQQAAREARARLQMPQAAPQQVAGSNFAAALEKTSGVSGGFSALPLKQTAAPAAPAAQPQTATPARMGMHVDITV
ncbi:MAG TPA: hypothetical protein VN175_13885 [Rhizomicrobium sp.]|jgi:hypothetical protein|nr:hypothetical protein [Rhizomicrobium sp.]